MLIINHAVLPLEQHLGWHSQCVAGPALGCHAFEVSLLVLDAGASTAAETCRGERVWLVQAGNGKQRLDGEPQSFHAPCSLQVPAGAEHQVINTGATPLRLIEIRAI